MYVAIIKIVVNFILNKDFVDIEYVNVSRPDYWKDTSFDRPLFSFNIYKFSSSTSRPTNVNWRNLM